MLPGGCNAHCSFCCWSRRNEPLSKTEYINELEKQLLKFIPHSHSINILGGEPLISPYLNDVLDLIKRLKQTHSFPKIVLTTNGSALPNKLHLFKDAINHINLSRHALTDCDNRLVFGQKAFLPGDKILYSAEQLIEMGIDLSVNCVLFEKTTVNTRKDILDFISFCKDNGAVAVCFKKVEGDSLDNLPQQDLFKNTPIIKSTSCDVCRTDTQIINNMVVYWQAALNKSSSVIKDLIINPDCTVTSDWKGKNIFEMQNF